MFEAAFAPVKKGPVSFLRPGPLAKWCGVYFGCGGHFIRKIDITCAIEKPVGAAVSGPYCQANTLIKGIAFAAGQVPLDAPTMTLSRRRFSGSEARAANTDRVRMFPQACLVDSGVHYHRIRPPLRSESGGEV